MAIRTKLGKVGEGNWSVPAGNIRIKVGGVGGGYWNQVTTAKVKIGAVGGGYWQDTGYIGGPGQCGTPYIVNWTYNLIVFGWTRPPVGEVPTLYEIQFLDEWGNLHGAGGHYPGPGTQYQHGIGTGGPTDLQPDTRFQVWVRAFGPAGLPITAPGIRAGPWSGLLRVQLGHDQRSVARTEWSTRGWSAAKFLNIGRDETDGIYLPSNCSVGRASWGFTPNITATQTANGSTRLVYWVTHGYPSHDLGPSPNPWQNSNFPLGEGQPGLIGFNCRGSGWAPRGGSGAYLSGNFFLEGTETYQTTVYDTYPAVPHGYW